ncbi:MAG TPA: SDR family NAD(P)-dependent oxidoreductase [Lichenihabitans sp.]|jgi:3-hydroxybutyrate dehydrogenase|nr:SDR family NAD(P)-dependent oxidoreductase [Lichenihabitans sp.]
MKSDAAPLRGRTALLTGSAGGLGFAMAEGLARAGCGVMINGVEPVETVERKCRDLEERTGSHVAYRQASVATAEGVGSLVDATVASFGALDILVNNAVVRHFGPIVDFSAAHWDEALAVNLSAAFHAIRLSLPGMRQRDFGRIFNMTSVYGSRGTINRVDYVTTKSALIGLTRAVALENLDRNVTCHAICPGSVLTPGTDDRILQIMQEQALSREDAEQAFLDGKQPGGRFIPAGSVTDLLVFLCGPIARDMTGSVLPVEAGWLAS